MASVSPRDSSTPELSASERSASELSPRELSPAAVSTFEESALGAVNRPLPLMLRACTRWWLRAPVAVITGFRVAGGERLPRTRRKLIVASNHAAFVDSVYLILALRPRFTICGAKPRLFRNRGLRALMALANILEVRGREQFLADCGALLAAGEILLIYPEMGRNPGGLGGFCDWTAEVALAAAAPILPCYLYGTTRGHRGAPRLLVGGELDPSGDAGGLTGRLRQAIADLAPASAAPAAEAR